jgi:amino acid transporter
MAEGLSPVGESTKSYAELRMETNMVRTVTWWHVFFIAAGVPALVLFNLGSISALTGPVAPLAWTISMIIGFIDCFIYAEIAGLHPRKSGGTAVHGATAWIRYSQYTAPLSLWCNWVAWSPVLAIGSGLAAGYLLSIFFAPDASINTWQITLVHFDNLGANGLDIRINATFIIGALILLAVWNIQHYGILRTARIQVILTLGSLIPLLVVTIVPIFQGSVVMSNFSPFAPIVNYEPLQYAWNHLGWQYFFGALFIAAWCTYGFETAVCYMSEFKNPGKDMSKAIIWSGVFCLFVYILVPFVFQGVLGTEAMLAPDIYSGAGIGLALASMMGAGAAVTKILVVLLVFTLLLAIMTAMSGSSRTIFQGGQDGWLPKYLAHLNDHHVPTYAMWTDLTFNLILLLMSDYIFILAASNVNYLIFNFLNLNAGWIHRIDNAKVPRPYKVPMPLFIAGVAMAYVNVWLMGSGANVWGKNTLLIGWIAALIAIPVFLFRHYVTDKGKFPDHMLGDLVLEGQTELGPKKAGAWPYVAIAVGFAIMFTGYWFFGRY